MMMMMVVDTFKCDIAVPPVGRRLRSQQDVLFVGQHEPGEVEHVLDEARLDVDVYRRVGMQADNSCIHTGLRASIFTATCCYLLYSITCCVYAVSMTSVHLSVCL